MNKSAVSFVTLLIVGPALYAPSSARAGLAPPFLFVEQSYSQTSTNVSFAGSDAFLALYITGASDFNAAYISIPTTPAATRVDLAYNPVMDSTGNYVAGSVSTYFPSSTGNVSAGLAALHAVYPMGTYTFTATNSATNASQSTTLVYDRDYWPTAPRSSGQTAVPLLSSTTYAKLQGLNANLTQTFNFNTFTTNGVTGPNVGTYLDIYDTSTGQAVYHSPVLTLGTSSLLLPANTLQANTSYAYDLSFFNELYCGPSSLYCGTNQPSPGYFLGFETQTEGVFTTATTATPPPTTVTVQGGTLANPVPLQSQGRIGQVDGFIGSEGAMDFYLFNWYGGTFTANAALTGADADASYEFELLDTFGHLLQTITLNADDNFTADLSQFLSAGRYEIGLLADSPFDPPFTITFGTAVGSVPEPATLGLVALGLTGLGLARRRRRNA